MSRTCQSCGLENPDAQDFCSCGEYLRWEPTNYIQAVQPTPVKEQPAEQPAAAATPAAAAAAPAAPAAKASTGAAPVAKAPAPAAPKEGTGNGHGKVAAPTAKPAAAKPTAAKPTAAKPTAMKPTAATPPAAAAPPPPPAAPAKPTLPDDAIGLTMGLPGQELAPGDVPHTRVEPGSRAVVTAMVRNQSGIVDNYDLRVGGWPADWVTISPPTLYLVPFGTSGTYEQAVEIHFHPPRAMEATAKTWDLELVVSSRAFDEDGASADILLDVLPYEEFETDFKPEVAKGRKKADYEIGVTNKANAPAEFDFSAMDTENACEFDFEYPAIVVDPGHREYVRLTVKAPKRHLIGRPLDHRFQVGADSRSGLAPAYPRQATFRQKALLPWWTIPFLMFLALLAILAWFLWPRTVEVPDLVKAGAVAEARELLTDKELSLGAQDQNKTDKVPEGTIVSQTPKPGEKVKKGSSVAIVYTVGTGKAEVPDVTGLGKQEAADTLQKAGFALGDVQPQPEIENGIVESQVPGAKEKRNKGSLIGVTLVAPEKSKAKKARDAGDKNPAAAAAAAAAAGGAPATTPGDIAVPNVIKLKEEEGATKIGEEKLIPRTQLRFDPAPAGTVVETVPPGGEKVGEGSEVKMIVSAGFPRVVLDNGKDVVIIDGGTGKSKSVPVAKGPQQEADASWSFDGSRIAFRSDNQVFVANVEDLEAPPVPITPDDKNVRNPTWAPTLDADVMAYIERPLEAGKGNGKMCFGEVKNTGLDGSCLKADKDFDIGRQVEWHPNGKEVLTVSYRVDPTTGQLTFGIRRFTTKKAFSVKASDWKDQGIVTDIERPGRGVLAASYAPDGKQMAMTANVGDSNRFIAYLAPAEDFLLSQAKATNVRACEVRWRPDGKELLITQADDSCTEIGDVARLPLNDLTKPVQLRTGAQTPVYEPLTLGAAAETGTKAEDVEPAPEQP